MIVVGQNLSAGQNVLSRQNLSADKTIEFYLCFYDSPPLVALSNLSQIMYLQPRDIFFLYNVYEA
jgi:hypothetical protein